MFDHEQRIEPNDFLKESAVKTIPQNLENLRQQVGEKDILWAKNKQERLVGNIKKLIPGSSAPEENETIIDHKDDSLYGRIYNYVFPENISINQWKVGGGMSLEQANILEIINNDSNSIEYKANSNHPSDWEIAKNLVLNDSYFKRHQELANALEKIDVTKVDTYPLDIYLDFNKDEDNTIFQIYNKYELSFQETELGFQPILDLSKAPSNEFLFTQTAVQLFTAFEKVQLELSQQLKNELINRHEKRYGNSYVTLGRELAKLVSDNNRDLSNFFSTEKNDDIWQKINLLEIPNDPAAAVLINTLKQLHQTSPPPSDLPISEERTSFLTGTCKDLETYFSSSVNEHSERIIEINNKKYLKEGSHHVDVNPMMINLEPIVFNGIRLPAGNLFRESNNKDAFHYMRPTAFCFDQEYANEVFGEEYRESINSWGPPDEIFKIISTTRN
ncbi:MAG: hypothetical protein WCG91_03950 [Candidatus Shapirobacteria bacterium]